LSSCFVRIEVSVDDIFGLVHFRISSNLTYMNTRKFDILYALCSEICISRI